MNKLQFYPVLWCLLLTTLMNITSSFAEELIPSVEVKRIENSTNVYKIHSSFNAFQKAHFVVENNLEGTSTTPIHSVLLQDVEISENASFEENSYKNTLPSTSQSENISEKSSLSASIVPVDGRKSFQQGMY